MEEDFGSEWLVTDQRGAFAMGTPAGLRTRKYHGFFMGIAGRSQTAFLVDLEIQCNGESLWPHCYASPDEGCIIHPDPAAAGIPLKYELKENGPLWKWHLKDGDLRFSIEPGYPGGIWLNWSWLSMNKTPATLRVRGIWGMRDLHSVGGKQWASNLVEGSMEMKDREGKGGEIQQRIFQVRGENKDAYCSLKGNWKWTSEPQWYQNFYYSLETERGYPATEDLFSEGVLEIQLASGESGAWILGEDLNDLNQEVSQHKKSRARVFDFVLTRPAGIVAGYPWFGEWGRDTFISLPGIAGAAVRVGNDPRRVSSWAQEVLHHWGSWIERSGMLPNLIERNGVPQWESADATLWWCHSLASLWMLSLNPPYPFAELRQEFSSLLNLAITAIEKGQHRFMNVNSAGLLEVSAPHATWMDARVEGTAVTPRVGVLPEINALWFEARCLQWLWSEGQEDFYSLETLGRQVLEVREPDRPNQIFLHSLPLAPSFVLKDWGRMERELMDIAENFWTPVGLRTLRPSHPSYHPSYSGNQEARDRAYHQGVVWGWLAGQFEAARQRFTLYLEDPTTRSKRSLASEDASKRFNPSQYDSLFPDSILRRAPVRGQIPELFDGEPPFTPRGAPAQAWSIACLEEAKARWHWKVDIKLDRALTRRKVQSKEVQSKGRPKDENENNLI
jgi:glycogen debranching enzyme